MKILESILRDKNRKLTRAQQRILRYIFDNFDEAVFLNASKVAKKAEVSEGVRMVFFLFWGGILLTKAQ